MTAVMTGRNTISLATIPHISSPQLLMSAMIYIHNRKHGLVKARALLDTCSTANFITEPMAKRLKLQVFTHSMSIGAINAASTEAKGLVRIKIQSMSDKFEKELTCLTIPTITDLIP